MVRTAWSSRQEHGGASDPGHGTLLDLAALRALHIPENAHLTRVVTSAAPCTLRSLNGLAGGALAMCWAPWDCVPNWRSLPGNRVAVALQAAGGSVVGQIDGPQDAGCAIADWASAGPAHVGGHPAGTDGVDQDPVAAQL